MIYIGTVPAGLNQDEASIGYDAYAILHYGIDRNGIHLPIHLIAWGSGQNALYAYLSMPFIWLFGLTPGSVRAVSLIMGLIGMAVFYLIAKRIFTTRSASIAAMFLIAINPWHIMMSRWALESNLLPTLILLAVYFLIRSFESPRWTYGFTIMLGLSLYAYGTAYFFVPVFALCSVFLLLYKRAVPLKAIIWNVLLFVLLAIPILLFIVINRMQQLDSVVTPLFSIPKLTMPRVEEVSSVFSGQLLQTALGNLRALIKLLVSGSDGLPWNSISPYGYAYPLGLPLAIIGLTAMMPSLQKRDPKGLGQSVVLLWLLASVLMACITSVNINRINVIFFPLMLLMTSGLMWLGKKWKPSVSLSAAVMAVFGLLFVTVYFRDFPNEIGPVFHESIGEAVQYASQESDGQIYVTDRVNMPYIYVLFYQKINPHTFLDTVQYANPGAAFQQVISFERYVFGQPVPSAREAASYILWNGDPLPAHIDGYKLKRFANYTVLIAASGTESSAAIPAAGEEPLPEGISNGGFEEGEVGWSFTPGTGIGNNKPYQGGFLAYLDPGSDRSITQTFSVPVTAAYTLSARISSGGEGGKLGIRVNGAVIAEQELSRNEEYQEVTLHMLALQQNQATEIYITGGNGWINLDEVRLER